MQLAHFYHCYAAGRWREAVAEHMCVLASTKFDGAFAVGLVGPQSACSEALREITGAFRAPDATFQSDRGFEQVTLAPLRQFARDATELGAGDSAVFYAHTKGAGNYGPWQAAWRRSMEQDVFVRRNDFLPALADHDVAGPHWLTPEKFKLPAGAHFSGNFWAARCDYLARLDPVPTNTRHDAEWWIGSGNPRTIDLHSGWPFGVGRTTPIMHRHFANTEALNAWKAEVAASPNRRR